MNVINLSCKPMGQLPSLFSLYRQCVCVCVSDKVVCHRSQPQSCRTGLEPRQLASCSHPCTLASLWFQSKALGFTVSVIPGDYLRVVFKLLFGFTIWPTLPMLAPGLQAVETCTSEGSGFKQCCSPWSPGHQMIFSSLLILIH